MRKDTSGNEIQFLLDGQAFFAELGAGLRSMAKAPPSSDTYVRMAFWKVDPACLIDRTPNTKTDLKTLLRLVADAGHVVQLIQWRPGLVARSLGQTQSGTVKKIVGDTVGEIEIEDGERIKQELSYVSSTEVTTQTGKHRGRVEVFLEVYKGWFAGTSAHQKIVLLSRAGKLSAIIGGFNLESGYYDTVDHAVRSKGWHDTAVKIEGPATIAIEQEWLRRWVKQYLVKTPTLQRADVQNQPTTNPGVDISIATTNSENWTARETHIRSLLCDQIKAAQKYVYLENYVLGDPVLVSALAERLASNTDLRVILVTSGFDDINSYLTGIAYRKLVVSARDGHIKDLAWRKVSAADCATWRLEEADHSSVDGLANNPWFKKDELCYAKKDGGQVQRIALWRIKAAESPRVGFYYPQRADKGKQPRDIYVHSKLALIDDKVAFIGSANFCYRSMVYDGEICAYITSADDTVKTIRKSLFDHYGVTFFVDSNERDAQTMVNQSRDNGVRLIAYQTSDFADTPKSPAPDFTWV